MNLGINAANGEYLGIVESDDYIKLNMYERLYKVAKEQDCEVLRCDVKKFKIEGDDGFCHLSERSLGFRWFFVFLLLTQFRGYR